MPTHPQIAILASNVLTGIGLKGILERIIPRAEVVLFGSFERFAEAEPERFFHYFVSSPLFLAHAAYFRERSHKTILLTDGRPREAHAGMHTLDICTCEERLMEDLLRMHRTGHPYRPAGTASVPTDRPLLSDREGEVLRLIAGGRLNKEIAEELGIALTTVITHRRNIMEKMGVRSAAELVLAAVEAGYAGEERL